MSYTSAKSRPTYTFDALLEFRDLNNTTASAAALVDGAAKVVDMGTGFFSADLVIDVTVAAVDGGDESYKFGIELSNNADFSTGAEFEGASLLIGDSSLTGGDTDTTTGRYVLTFNNRPVDGTTYRYARLYVTHAGSTSSLTASAFASIHQ
jgi:hypothetical protein